MTPEALTWHLVAKTLGQVVFSLALIGAGGFLLLLAHDLRCQRRERTRGLSR